MSGLFEFTQYQAEALLICLAGSLIWAGVLFIGARGIERSGTMTSAEKLWTAALLFAVLPSLVAPTLAAFGVSLRPAPEPALFEAAPLIVTTAIPVKEAAAVSKPALVTTGQMIGAGALLYVYGVFLTFFLWLARQICLNYAVARAETVEDARLIERIEDWAERLDVRMPALKRSHHVSSVCITGVLRQTVLIPHGIEMRVTSDDLVLMCAHELAHVRRGDTRLFTATQLARVLFWFNPLVARIAAHAELAAEESADALVLAKGVDRRTYAACFVEGLKFAAFKMNVQPSLAPSFTPPDRHGRRRRLNSILSPEPARRTPLATRLMLSAAASTVALVAVGQAALAVDPGSAAERRSALGELPLIGEITLGFGEKAPVAGGKAGAAHEGLDIKAAKGAKVFAPGDGIVVEATDLYNGSPAWGKVVVIDHGHGLVTRYAHLDSYSVRRGQRVKTGDVIAAVGATGKVTGPHLHFETLRDGEAIDPAAVIATAPQAPVAPVFEAPADPAELPAPLNEEPPAPAAVPAAKPAPAAAPAPAARPAPNAIAGLNYSYGMTIPRELAGAPGNLEFAPAEDFVEFRNIEPLIADAPRGFAFGQAFAASGLYASADADGLAFRDGAAFDRIAEDLERRLLGAIDGENSGSYNLTFTNGDKVYRFSSDEPMTAERRAELREALKEMRKHTEGARKDALRHREEARREMARSRAEARELAEADAAEELRAHREELEEIRREAKMARRESLDIQREALEQARADLDEDIEAEVESALADLDAAESDLSDAGLSDEEIASARASIGEQRRHILRDSKTHRRAIETARRQIETQIAEIERMIETLDEEALGD